MGRPSNRRRSARRLGRRERARVKKPRRNAFYGDVPGAGIVHVKLGRKKWQRFTHWALPRMFAHPAGDSITPKASA